MHRTDVSPLFIGFLGLLSGAVVVSTVYCIARTLVRERNPLSPLNQMARTPMPQTSSDEHNLSSTSSSKSETQLIVYKCTDEKQEDTCAVCLSEFVEGEEVRILSDCAHAFHVPCIDMWLYSHSSCPLCRAPLLPHTIMPGENTAPLPPHTVPMEESYSVPPSQLPWGLPFFGV